MARPFKATTTKGYNSSSKFFLLKNRKSTTGKYQLKIRLTVHSKPSYSTDCPVLFPETETVKLYESEFDSRTNSVTGGFENGKLRAFKAFLVDLANNAVTIGDNLFKEGKRVNDTLFKELLYNSIPRVYVPEGLKPEYEQFKDIADMFSTPNDSPKSEDELRQEFLINAKVHDRTKFTTEEIYRKDMFDKSNIFEVFGRLYYPDFVTGAKILTNSYEDVLFKLFVYYEKAKVKPSKNVKDFDFKWCFDFLKWDFEHGRLNYNPIKFDVLRYDTEIFNRGHVPYKGSESRKKILKHFKGCVNTLVDMKLLPPVNLKKLKLDTLLPKEVKITEQNTRKQFALKKNEFDYLFYYDFKDELLNQVRDIFVLQTMFGGLRIGEYTTDNIKVIEDVKNDYIVSYARQKTKGNKIVKIQNPFNAYTTAIYKKYKSLPMLTTTVSGQTIFDRDGFNDKLREIAGIIGLNRVLVYDVDNTHVEIKEVFTSLFARHSMYQIFADAGMDDNTVNFFTGHGEGSGAHTHYRQRNTIENKRKWLKQYNIVPASVPADVKKDNKKLRKFFKVV